MYKLKRCRAGKTTSGIFCKSLLEYLISFNMEAEWESLASDTSKGVLHPPDPIKLKVSLRYWLSKHTSGQFYLIPNLSVVLSSAHFCKIPSAQRIQTVYLSFRDVMYIYKKITTLKPQSSSSKICFESKETENGQKTLIYSSLAHLQIKISQVKGHLLSKPFQALSANTQ